MSTDPLSVADDWPHPMSDPLRASGDWALRATIAPSDGDLECKAGKAAAQGTPMRANGSPTHGSPCGGIADPLQTSPINSCTSPSPLSYLPPEIPGMTPSQQPSPAVHAPSPSPSPSLSRVASPRPPADPQLDPGTLEGLMHMLGPKLLTRRFHAEEITQVWVWIRRQSDFVYFPPMLSLQPQP